MLKNIAFTDVGSIASILALFLTLMIFFNIRRIKKFYIFKIRSPELSKKLELIVQNISAFLSNYESSVNSIDEEVAKCEVVLNSLKRKSSGSTKKFVKYVIGKLNKYQNKPDKKTEHNLREIYLNTLKILEEIKTIQDDYKWER